MNRIAKIVFSSFVCLVSIGSLYADGKKTAVIPPSFSEAECRYYSNWLQGEFQKISREGGAHSTSAYFANNLGAQAFFLEAELYFLVNRKLNSLSGDQRRTFLKSHLAWRDAYQRELKKRNEENARQFRGTMLIGMLEGEKVDLLQKYLDSFPERLPLKYDFRKEK